ncbi:MAG: zinc metallopeptidase [Candidatus Cloacimonetes bacterium]|nr:zinc metallopeptidase [Candidatus Cloacimonadota bacterium]
MFFDPTFLLLIPVMILAIWAQTNVKSSYKKYSQVKNSINISGAEAAEQILKKNGIYDVPVHVGKGFLIDHYHPGKKEVVLSEEVYYGTSIASLSIAAHEVGHALQHSRKYYPVVMRGGLLPVANIGSQAAFPLFIIGMLFEATNLMNLGIILFSGALLFHLVTLPVEFNASSRAMVQISDGFIRNEKDLKDCRKMLNAAALTYVASTLVSLMHLIRMILIRGRR